MYKKAFVVGPPVSGSDFFGRRLLIRAIEASLSASSSVLLIGERRIGKTSLMRQSRALVESAPELLAGSHITFVDLEGLILPSENPGSSLIRAILKTIRGINDTRIAVPEVSQDTITEWPDLFDALRQLSKNGIQLFFLFDELDSAILDSPSAIPAMLRSIATAGHLVIATSFRDPTDVNHNSVYGSPWWNVFCIERVGLFARDESRELLTNLSERGGRSFHAQEIDFLTEVFGDHPYILQMAGATVFNRSDFVACVRSKRVNALEEAAALTSEQLQHHFGYTINHLGVSQIKVLRAIVSGEAVEDIQALGCLVDRGILRGSTQEGFAPFSLTFDMFLREMFERIPEPVEARPRGPTWDKV